MNIVLSSLAAGGESVIDRLLEFEKTNGPSIAEDGYWGSVGIITLTGIVVVFAILGLLIALFYGMGAAFQAIDKKKAAKKVAEAAAKKNAVQAAPVPVVEVEEVAEDEDEEEIIAVISAAIAAYSEQDGKSYEIRSIRRKDNKTRSAWSLAGIGENVRPF